MNAVTFSAPGKLYLLGEYAVLEGAPALLRAVDRRVTVTLTEPAVPSTAEKGWILTAPELGIHGLHLGANATVPEGIDGSIPRKLTLFTEVCNAVNTLAPAQAAFDITIDSAPFFQDGHKFGLGSSAAVAVALTAALAASRGLTLTHSELFALATKAHSSAQGGKGSGGDIAASVYGGHILFRKGSEPRRVNWPVDLNPFAVVTGTGSSTVDLVSRVADYAANNPTQYRIDLDHLSSLARQAEDALANAETFLALADNYFHAVEMLDTHARAGIVTARHLELRKIAAASGAVFKPSGAGGGDLGLVFATLETTDHPQSVFTEAGAPVILVPHSPDGVRREPA